MRRIIATAVVTVSAILLFAACGGEERPAPVRAPAAATTIGATAAAAATTRSTPTAIVASVATPAASAGALTSPAMSGSASAASAGSLAAAPLTAMLREHLAPLGGGDRVPASMPVALAGLDRFRYTMTVEMNVTCTATAQCGGFSGPDAGKMALTVTGAHVAPDRHHVRCTGGVDGVVIDEEVIAIGDQRWVRDEQTRGAFVRRAAEHCQPDFSVTDVAGTFGGDLSGFTVAGEERVNGTLATHYTIAYSFAQLLRDMAAGFGGDPDEVDLSELEGADFSMTVDLWLAKVEQWPVKLIFRFGGGDESGSFELVARWEMREINAPSVTITAP